MPYTANIFNVNWSRLQRWLLPTFLRKAKTIALVNALVAPINTLHNKFLLFRKDVQYRLSITPQVCYLEKALNDKYDRQLRRIVIDDATEYAAVVFFQQEELKPVKFFQKSEALPKVVYQREEVGAFTTDFIILVPVTVPFDMNELVAFVNFFKLAGKTFRVQIV